MKLENFVKDQKEMMVELQCKMDEQEAIIKTANEAEKEAFNVMENAIKERVRDWDKSDLIEYLRITNEDNDIAGVEQQIVMHAFCKTHKDRDGRAVMQALKASVANNMVDLLTGIMLGI